MHVYNEIHVLLSTLTIEHTMTQKAQEHHNNSGVFTGLSNGA